ncbi:MULTISPECIES: DUF2585 family protein [Luteimonas]|nr:MULTISPECIES: DUF2585 family protein [Luteimonas]RPD88453.1 DUF2585 family protein [Luteimonas sp. 100069]
MTRRSGWHRDARLAFPRLRWLRHVGVVVAATLAVHVWWLLWMGRSLTCPCGVVSLWQSGADPSQNSQQIADAYSSLHVAFGMGLYLVFSWLRPRWPVIDRALLALISSTIWEMIENTPWVVLVLNNAANAAPDYRGDSVLNSLADTAFALLGFTIALGLPVRWVVVIALALETIATLLIHDGFVLIVWRLLDGMRG